MCSIQPERLTHHKLGHRPNTQGIALQQNIHENHSNDTGTLRSH